MGYVSKVYSSSKLKQCDHCGSRIHRGEKMYEGKLLNSKVYCSEKCAREAGHKVTWI